MRKIMFNLDKFINTYVTKRNQSMFIVDIENNREQLSKKIKSVVFLRNKIIKQL